MLKNMIVPTSFMMICVVLAMYSVTIVKDQMDQVMIMSALFGYGAGYFVCSFGKELEKRDKE
ncbi:hypothetical protein LH47_02295 [Anoxybacillus thermarum]|uniref:Uncharacterized protein n=2 Tax=Anoxybacillus thermarum TaxID=404937 RepID=A0A0D0QVT9_9BACL|nr:hypothetical protein LH47_02295 [Anoxybacillus thermarum]